MASLASETTPVSGRPDLIGRGERRVYILPTRYGLVYAALVGGMLLGSLNYNNNLGLLLSFLLVGQGLVVMIHTWRNLRGLQITLLKAPPVFAGQPATFPLDMAALGRRARPAIAVEAPGADGGCQDIGSGEKARFALSVATSARGALELGCLRVSTRFPLGLFRAWSYVEPQAEALVYPRPARRAGRRLPGRTVGDGRGEAGEGTDDFVGLRGYRPGDSPRQIDWKALARERGLVTKQFVGNDSDRVWIDWDAWPGVNIEERLSRLCREVLDAGAAAAEYGLRVPGREILPGSGGTHQHRCLAALARFREAQ